MSVVRFRPWPPNDCFTPSKEVHKPASILVISGFFVLRHSFPSIAINLLLLVYFSFDTNIRKVDTNRRDCDEAD